MIRHTAVFRLKHPAGSAAEVDFLKAIAKLKSIVGVQKFEVLRQVSPKSEFTFGVSMEFAAQAAYDGYNVRPDHVALVVQTQFYHREEIYSLLGRDLGFTAQ